MLNECAYRQIGGWRVQRLLETMSPWRSACALELKLINTHCEFVSRVVPWSSPNPLWNHQVKDRQRRDSLSISALDLRRPRSLIQHNVNNPNVEEEISMLIAQHAGGGVRCNWSDSATTYIRGLQLLVAPLRPNRRFSLLSCFTALRWHGDVTILIPGQPFTSSCQ